MSADNNNVCDASGDSLNPVPEREMGYPRAGTVVVVGSLAKIRSSCGKFFRLLDMSACSRLDGFRLSNLQPKPTRLQGVKAGFKRSRAPGIEFQETWKVLLEQFARLTAVSLDEVCAVFETNVFGVIAVTRAMLPLLREAPAGRIVNVSSASGC